MNRTHSFFWNHIKYVLLKELSLEFLQLGRFKEAFDFAMRSHNLDPADSKLAEHVTQLRAKIDAEEARTGSDSDARVERRASRIRSISEYLFRAEADESLDSHSIDRDDSDYFDDDMDDMDMEIEMSVAEEEELRFREAGMPPGSGLDLKLQHRGDTAGRVQSHPKNGSSSSDSSFLQVGTYASQDVDIPHVSSEFNFQFFLFTLVFFKQLN